MKSKKVLFIGSFKQSKGGNFGGVYFASNSLKAQLASSGFKIIPLDITLDDINEIGVIRRLPKLFLRQLEFLLLIIRNYNAEYLFVFLSGGNSYLDKLPLLMLANLLGIKIFSFPRSGYLIRDVQKFFYKKCIENVLNMSDRVICQSTYWQNTIEKLVEDNKKLVVIENWFKEATIHESKKLSFSSYSLNSTNVFKIIYVSRIEEAKGIFDLIEAVPFLLGKLTFEINIYGNGSSLDKVKKKIIDLNLGGVIKLKGWLSQDKLLEEINKNHLAIFPSRFEGYPNSLLDLIFSKIPVIASNIPSVNAVGLDHIHYYEPENIKELSDKIIFVYHNYSESVSKLKRLWDISVSRNNIKTATNKLISLME